MGLVDLLVIGNRQLEACILKSFCKAHCTACHSSIALHLVIVLLTMQCTDFVLGASDRGVLDNTLGLAGCVLSCVKLAPVCSLYLAIIA